MDFLAPWLRASDRSIFGSPRGQQGVQSTSLVYSNSLVASSHFEVVGVRNLGRKVLSNPPRLVHFLSKRRLSASYAYTRTFTCAKIIFNFLSRASVRLALFSPHKSRLCFVEQYAGISDNYNNFQASAALILQNFGGFSRTLTEFSKILRKFQQNHQLLLKF